VDVVRSTAAGDTVTGAVCVTPPVTEIVFDSAFVELNVDVSTPLPFVDPLAGENVFELPIEPKRTKPPAIGLPNWSSSVTVMVEAVEPATQELAQAVMLAVVGPRLTWCR